MRYNKLRLFVQICFWPGNIALGASQVPDDRSRQRYWQFANDFMDACQAVWEKTATGIAPESWSWSVNTNRGEPPTRKRQQSMIRSFTIDNGLYDLRPGSTTTTQGKRETCYLIMH